MGAATKPQATAGLSPKGATALGSWVCLWPARPANGAENEEEGEQVAASNDFDQSLCQALFVCRCICSIANLQLRHARTTQGVFTPSRKRRQSWAVFSLVGQAGQVVRTRGLGAAAATSGKPATFQPDRFPAGCSLDRIPRGRASQRCCLHVWFAAPFSLRARGAEPDLRA